jgi:hypothetical protein
MDLDWLRNMSSRSLNSKIMSWQRKEESDLKMLFFGFLFSRKEISYLHSVELIRAFGNRVTLDYRWGFSIYLQNYRASNIINDFFIFAISQDISIHIWEWKSISVIKWCLLISKL